MTKKLIGKKFKGKKEKNQSSAPYLVEALNANHFPFIYNKNHNISFGGLEKFHSFNPCKYRDIANNLVKESSLQNTSFIGATPVTKNQLALAHSADYLKSLNRSRIVSQICEFPPMAFVPNGIVQKFVLNPMYHQVGSTIAAGYMALKYGFAINLGGGMHHSTATIGPNSSIHTESVEGGGWCVFADVPLAIKSLQNDKLIKTAMIIDLDAHQGNGNSRSKLTGFFAPGSVYIIDFFNSHAYPGDRLAMKGIDLPYGLKPSCTTSEYLQYVKEALVKGFRDFKPDIVFYNAGTDILSGDPLGHMNISADGIVKRDELVWEACIKKNIPIVQVLSGGYAKQSARLVSDCILNLLKKFDLVNLAKKNYAKNMMTDSD